MTHYTIQNSTTFLGVRRKVTTLTSQHGSIFDPLLGVYWWFRDAGSAHSVHRLSLRLARRFGTLYQIP